MPQSTKTFFGKFSNALMSKLFVLHRLAEDQLAAPPQPALGGTDVSTENEAEKATFGTNRRRAAHATNRIRRHLVRSLFARWVEGLVPRLRRFGISGSMSSKSVRTFNSQLNFTTS